MKLNPNLIVRFSIGERVTRRIHPKEKSYNGRIVGISGVICPLSGIEYAVAKDGESDNNFEFVPRECLQSNECKGFEVKFKPALETNLNIGIDTIIYGELIRFDSHVSTQFAVHQRLKAWIEDPNELWTVSITVCGFEVSPKCRAKTKGEAIEKAKLVLREIALDTMQQAIESKPILNPVKRTLKGVNVSVNA